MIFQDEPILMVHGEQRCGEATNGSHAGLHPVRDASLGKRSCKMDGSHEAQ